MAARRPRLVNGHKCGAATQIPGCPWRGQLDLPPAEQTSFRPRPWHAAQDGVAGRDPAPGLRISLESNQTQLQGTLLSGQQALRTAITASSYPPGSAQKRTGGFQGGQKTGIPSHPRGHRDVPLTQAQRCLCRQVWEQESWHRGEPRVGRQPF